MNTIKKISILFLTAVFLASGMGITIGSMICLESGKGKVSFSLMEDCCGKKAENCCDEDPAAPSNSLYSFEKGECCAISNLSIKLTEFSSAKKVQFEQPVLDVPFFVAQRIPSDLAAAQRPSTVFNDLPSPYHGRTLLNHISILRV